MKFRSSPFSLLPSQFLGRRSLIGYGLKPIGFADTFCSAVLMLFNMSILPLSVPFTYFYSQPLCDVCHFLSQHLLKCCKICRGDHVCSQVCWSFTCWCCCRGPVLGASETFERFHPWRLSTTLRDHDKCK